MTESRYDSNHDDAVRRGFVREVHVLRQAVFALLLACLTVSICFNVFLFRVNAGLSEQNKRFEMQLATAYETRRFLETLVRDMRQSPAAQVLSQYNPMLRQLSISPFEP